MSLQEKLAMDLKDAMKNKEQVKKSVVTLVRSAVKQKEVDERVTLTDQDVLQIISKQLKQRKDALVDFEKAGREDLISQTKEEIAILSAYLPEQLTDEKLFELVKEAAQEVGATSMKDMGRLIAKVTAAAQGQADGKRIHEMAKQLFQS